MDDTTRKDLKTLRQEKQAPVSQAQAYMKQTRQVRQKIVNQLKAAGPSTVPALADHCQLPTPEVLWHLASMRKYGQIKESAQEGDYFTYTLCEDKNSC
jgi:predicted transcriptional regulator